jgi:iron complex outermembrane recepter protein
MRSLYGLLVLAALIVGPAASGQTPLTGRVIDAPSGDPLPGATVQIVETGQGSVTDGTGSFQFADLAAGAYTVRIRHVGYRPHEETIAMSRVEPLTIRLRPETALTDEVVVTGSPLGSAARYQAAQVLGREALQRRAATSFGEMLDGEPGLAMRSFGPAPARPVLRGFDGDRLVVLENGERAGDLAETAADHAMSIDPLAADRIEIVRGPASLLYGTGALGGVVNILSDDLTRSWAPGLTGDAALQLGSVNRQGAGFTRLRYGGASWAASGRLALRGAGDLRTPEGVLPETSLRNVDLGAGVAHRHQGFDGALFASGLHRTYGLPEGLEDPDERVEIRMERQSVQGQARWGARGPFDALELRVLAARYAHDEVEIEDGEEEVELGFDQRSLSTTLLAQHAAWGPFAQGAIGLSGFARDLAVHGDEALTPDGQAWTAAAFTLQEAVLTPQVRLQLGIRGEVQRLKLRPNEQYPGAADQRTTPTLSAALGLNVRPTASMEIGTQIAQAFRVPTLEERYSNAAHIGAGAFEIGDPNLSTERALGADGFVRFQRGVLHAEVAAFVSHVRDFVVYRPTGEIHGPSGLPIFVYEADDARLLGGEVQAALRLPAGLQIDASADMVRGTRLGDHQPLPRIPPVRGRLAVVLDRASWWAGGSVRAVAAQHRVDAEEEPTPGYTLIGAEGGLRVGPGGVHVVSLRLDNLFDVAYRDHLSRVESRDAPMPGRNVALTYRLMW